jgi:hypothetical protein
MVSVALLLLLAGCSRRGASAERTHRMGERVEVAGLTYTVLDAAWKAQLGDEVKPRIPKDRFLVLHLTITNGTSKEAVAPMLSLVDQSGATYPEISDGEGIPQWLGMLRQIRPSQTEEGRIAFDVRSGTYKLRVTGGDDPDEEKSALIEIPLTLDYETPAVVPPKPGS